MRKYKLAFTPRLVAALLVFLFSVLIGFVLYCFGFFGDLGLLIYCIWMSIPFITSVELVLITDEAIAKHQRRLAQRRKRLNKENN